VGLLDGVDDVGEPVDLISERERDKDSEERTRRVGEGQERKSESQSGKIRAELPASTRLGSKSKRTSERT